MLPLYTKIDPSISKDVTVTAYILPCALYVGIDVKQYKIWTAAQSQRFLTTANMATVEEVVIIYSLRKRQNQRQCCSIITSKLH